jgi:hypothetical protein
LVITGLTGTLGTVSLTGANSQLTLDGTGYTVDSSFNAVNGQSVNLHGSWTAAPGVNLSTNGGTLGLGTPGDVTKTWDTTGTISVTNGTVKLGGATSSLSALTVTISTINVVSTYTTAQITPLLGGNKLSVGAGGVLDNTNATLALDGAAQTLTLAGGKLTSGTVTATNGARVVVTGYGSTFDGLTLNSDVDMTTSNANATVLDGLTLNGTLLLGDRAGQTTSTLNFSGDQTLDGTGTIHFGQTNSPNRLNLLSVPYGNTLTIGSGITISQGNGAIGSAYNYYYSQGSVVNQGVIDADGGGSSIVLNLNSFSNEGTIEASNGGSLTVTGLASGLGTVILQDANSALTLNGSSYTVDSSFNLTDGQTLNLLGTWSSPAGVTIMTTDATLGLGTPGDSSAAWSAGDAISATGSTVYLGGTASSIASLTVTSSSVHVVGTYTASELAGAINDTNSLEIGQGGVLDNTGNTLNLDANTGSLKIAGGTLINGSVTATGGAKVVVTGSGSVLNGVTLNSDLDLTQGYVNATVENGLTLNGTLLLGDPNGQSTSVLNFSGSQTLDGTGAVQFGAPDSPYSFNQLAVYYGSTLTIGAGITINQGKGTIGSAYYYYYNQGTVVNLGVIKADGSGTSITINLNSFSNQGTIQASNGGSLTVTGLNSGLGTVVFTDANSALSLDGINYAVDSSFSASNGQTLKLLGSWTADAGIAITATDATLGLGSPGSNSDWETSGSISAANSTVSLGGTTSSLGNVTITNSMLNIVSTYTTAQLQPLQTSNQLAIETNGVLDNTNNTLTLDATTGSLTLDGGTLRGGTVSASGGSQVVVTAANSSVLDGVTLNSDLDLTARGAYVTILDGMTLNGTARIGDPIGGSGATLNFGGNQTLDGTGLIRFGNFGDPNYQQNVLSVAYGATLTVGAGITIAGGSGAIGMPN